VHLLLLLKALILHPAMHMVLGDAVVRGEDNGGLGISSGVLHLADMVCLLLSAVQVGIHSHHHLLLPTLLADLPTTTSLLVLPLLRLPVHTEAMEAVDNPLTADALGWIPLLWTRNVNRGSLQLNFETK